MDQGTPSLQSLMNKMANHLDEILPASMQTAPIEADWPLIQLYLGIDPILAGLYKQYCDARARLEQLNREIGTAEPMTEIAVDMRDSLHSAVSTRLLELAEDETTQQIVLKSKPIATRHKIANPVENFDQMMAFMIWARMTLKNAPQHHVIRRHFSQAA